MTLETREINNSQDNSFLYVVAQIFSHDPKTRRRITYFEYYRNFSLRNFIIHQLNNGILPQDLIARQDQFGHIEITQRVYQNYAFSIRIEFNMSRIILPPTHYGILPFRMPTPEVFSITYFNENLANLVQYDPIFDLVVDYLNKLCNRILELFSIASLLLTSKDNLQGELGENELATALIIQNNERCRQIQTITGEPTYPQVNGQAIPGRGMQLKDVYTQLKRGLLDPRVPL